MKILKARNLKILILCFVLLDTCSFGVNAAEDKQLLQARKDLLLAEETAKRIESELKQLRLDNNMSMEIISDYQIYLDRVQKMVILHQTRVQNFEPKMAATKPKEKSEKDQNPNPTVKKTYTDRERMIREFDQSLAAFDEFILQELDLLDQQKTQLSEEEALNGLAAEAAAAVKRLETIGINVLPNQDQSGERNGESEEGGASEVYEPSFLEPFGNEAIRSEENRRVPTVSEGFIGDDDIVARQLKEAAEKEKDPLLKEKLLKEYHAYKRALRGSQKSLGERDFEESDKNP